MEKLKTNFNLKIGTSESGKVVRSDLWKLKNMLVVGNVGAGKTEFLKDLILNFYQNKLPQNVRVMIFDPKEIEFNDFNNNLPNCEVVTGLKKAKHLLELYYGHVKIGNLRATEGKNFDSDYILTPKVTLMFVDELADYVVSDKEMEECLCEIFKNGYKAGVFPVFATYNLKLLPKTIQESFNSTISFRCDNNFLLPDEIKKQCSQIDNFGAVFYKKDGETIKLKPIDLDKNLSVYNLAARYKRKLIFWQDFSILKDKNFQAMVELAIKEGTICATRIRKEVGCGYPLAARFIDMMECLGFISKAKQAFSRDVYITKKEFDEILKLIGER